MGAPLVAQDPDVEVDLRHPDRVGVGAREVEALVELGPALQGVGDVALVGRLRPLSVPAGRELDVDLKLWGTKIITFVVCEG